MAGHFFLRRIYFLGKRNLQRVDLTRLADFLENALSQNPRIALWRRRLNSARLWWI
jgi:hypothetical protein